MNTYLSAKRAIVVSMPIEHFKTTNRLELTNFKNITELPSEANTFKNQYRHMLSTKLGNDRKPKEIIIPPLNTDIRFSETLPMSTRKQKEVVEHFWDFPPIYMLQKVIDIGSNDHRENFSWTIPNKRDDELALAKKLLISAPFNQQGCGSCWAVAVCTTMSDCLVVAGVLDWEPKISPTYAMACYPQGRCEGGIPAILAKDLETSGISDESCIDYSWCKDNKNCNTEDAAEHFFNIEPEKLSQIIPKCGCDNYSDRYYFFLDKGTEMISISQAWTINDFRKMVQNHILNFGPVIGGYIVLKNFLNGNFTNIEEGVYFDRADYDNIGHDEQLFFSDTVSSPLNSVGLHAVSIVGWGLAKNIQFDNGKRGDVPFWYCRNSWDEQWGDRGYFKIAMYPFNKIAQFDKEINANLGTQAVRIGGIMLMRATKAPELIVSDNDQSKYNNNLIPTLGINDDIPQLHDVTQLNFKPYTDENIKRQMAISSQNITWNSDNQNLENITNRPNPMMNAWDRIIR